MAPTKPNIHSLLGLPKSATRYKVNKAYKKAAHATHPDRGGSTEAMAALNAAKDAYDNGGVAETVLDTDNDNDGDIDMNDNESDEEYQQGEGPLSDGEDVSGPETEVGGGESDEGEFGFNVNYGDLKKISGRYFAVVMEELGLEVSVKKHEELCGCDLDDPKSLHFLKGVDDDDTDSGVEDLDDVNEELEDEALNNGEAEDIDDIDEGFEEGDEKD